MNWYKVAPDYVANNWALARVCSRMFDGKILIHTGFTHFAPGDSASQVLNRWFDARDCYWNPAFRKDYWVEIQRDA